MGSTHVNIDKIVASNGYVLDLVNLTLDGEALATVTSLNAVDGKVDNLLAATGIVSGETDAGTFTGNILTDNIPLKGSVQEVADAVETKQNTLSDGDGVDITADEISVDLSPTPYLEISGGKLQGKVLDEDNMSSDSDEHLPTQQSVKAYADAGDAANQSSITILEGEMDDVQETLGNSEAGAPTLVTTTHNGITVSDFLDSISTDGLGAYGTFTSGDPLYDDWGILVFHIRIAGRRTLTQMTIVFG